MKRIWMNKLYIFKKSCNLTGLFFSILGIASTFTSLSDFINPNYSPLRRLLISVFILMIVWIITVIGCSVYVCKKRKVAVLDLNGGHHVYIQYGNILLANKIFSTNTRINVVIPVNRCFDTIVDDDLISSNTLHGKIFKELYACKKYNEDSLNSIIQENLKSQHHVPETLSIDEKRKGNLRRYPVGAIAEIKGTEKCTYFLLGLTAFDSSLSAAISDEDYAYSIIKLLQFCNVRSQQFPVIMPLIGGGLSKTNKAEKDILDYLIRTLKLYKNNINYDIHIVVRESGKDSIPIVGL